MADARSFPTNPAYEYCWPHHDGGIAWDVQAPAGTDVLAVFDGVIQDRSNGLGGNILDIVADDGWTARYGHLQDKTVRNGQRVRAGELLGHVGCTGSLCGGPHLHFAVTRGPMHADGNGDVPPCEWLAGVTPNPGGDRREAGGGSGGRVAGVPSWVLLLGGVYLVWSLADEL